MAKTATKAHPKTTKRAGSKRASRRSPASNNSVIYGRDRLEWLTVVWVLLIVIFLVAVIKVYATG